MATKLDAGQKHILLLISKGGDAEGWTKVSKYVVPVISKIPKELLEFESFGEEGGRVRLTDIGNNIIEAMDWL